MSDRPNVLVIMAEQFRGDCLGVEGHPQLLTPTLDRLAVEGARFTRAYSTSPVCVPARRSFLTGTFPSTHGVFGNRNAEFVGPTIADRMADAGYETAWIGRGMHQHPPSEPCGFEHVVASDYRAPGNPYEEWLAENAPPGSGGYYGSGVMHNDWTARPFHMPDGCHHTNWTVNQALDFLEKRDTDRPFFLVVSFLAAHPPLVPPAPYFERYIRTGVDDPVIGDWAVPPKNDGLGLGPAPSRVNLTGEALLSCRAGYYGLINHLDDQLNRLLNTVTGVGRMTGGNTATIFCADHGEMLGDHYCWRKSLPYEPSARVPLLIRAPDRLGAPRGLTPSQPVGLEDIMPTVLDMAGETPPEDIDGRSLLPLLRGEGAPWREYIQIECAPTFQCLTNGREKYVWFVADGREQFFELESDPQELHNAVADARCADRVALWRQRMVDTLTGRPEGFSDGERLIPGRPYPAVQQRSNG